MFRSPLLSALAVAAALAAAGSAIAATPAKKAPEASSAGMVNIRCFLLGNLFAKQAKDDSAKQIAALVRFYNLGQIQAKMSRVQIKQAIVTAGTAITQANAPGLMGECTHNLETADRAMGAIGAEMQQQQQQQPGAQPPAQSPAQQPPKK